MDGFTQSQEGLSWFGTTSRDGCGVASTTVYSISAAISNMASGVANTHPARQATIGGLSISRRYYGYTDP